VLLNADAHRAAFLPPRAALPFLERTELFLYPIAVIALMLPFAILGGFNPCRALLSIYFGKTHAAG
jgi:hypothetical protein